MTFHDSRTRLSLVFVGQPYPIRAHLDHGGSNSEACGEAINPSFEPLKTGHISGSWQCNVGDFEPPNRTASDDDEFILPGAKHL